MAKPKYHHGDLRNALLRTGLELLEETGRPGLSLRAIAARAGVSHAAPKNHFGNFGGLLTAMAAEGFRMHRDAMRAEIAAAPDDRNEQLRAALVGYAAFARARPHLLNLMFSSEEFDADDAAFREAGESSYAVLAEICEGLDHPRKAALPGNYAAELMVWSLAHGFAHLAINGQLDRARALIGRELSPLDIAPEFAFAPEPGRR